MGQRRCESRLMIVPPLLALEEVLLKYHGRTLTEALRRRRARGNGTAAVPLPLRSQGWLDRP
jgi:hypothetical protein